VSQDPDIGSGPVHTMIDTLFSFSYTEPFPDHEERLKELMDFLDLPKKVLNEDYDTLSGGEKQRIALIIALLLGRNIFLLDEITSSLDRDLKRKVIRHFTSNPAWTVLAISHDRDWLKRKEVKIVRVGS
jgi:putative ABC transport system ATP-binding protein